MSAAHHSVRHETSDADSGLATTKGDHSLESCVLGNDRYQIEMLANLCKVPATDALVAVTWPNTRDGICFPARVLAIVP